MSNKKHKGLTRRSSGLMALEPRFMFDGAAVDTAVDSIAHPDTMVVTDAHPMFDASALSSLHLAPAMELVQEQVRQAAAQWNDAQWMEVFNIQANDTKAVSALHEVQRQILDGSYQVRVVEVDAAQMGLSMAAFAAKGPDGQPTVFLNKAWWSGAEQDPRLVQALMEEVGHSIDAALHPQQDTAGDEGQLFAVKVLGLNETSEALAQVMAENDAGQLLYNGEVYQVEHATFNFTTAYALAPEYRYYAEKEQESDRFLGQSLGVASINDNTGLGTFSGNDVVVDLTINGTTYHGWISRPIKDQGQVKGFYFWYDPTFVDFSTASANGNQDIDGDATNNRGFVLVVDQTWFGTITSGTPVHNNGSVNTNVYEVGSSSDRVDSALNSVLPVNVAPAATTDTSNVSLAAGLSGGPALEAGGLSNATAGANAIGNALSNDTDSNGDTLKVTYVGTNTASSSVSASSTSANGTVVTGLYGTLTIGGDGSYKYVVNNDNTAVQALRLSTNTLTDSFTYSIADPSGLASSAKINIVIQGANDTPVAANDYNVAKESLLADSNTSQYTSSDPLGYKATGNVLTNDSDVDGNGETKAISGMSVSGSATGVSAGAGASVTTLSFGSLPGNVSAGYYVFIDGDNTANNNAGSLTALTDSSGKQITVSSIDSAAKTFTLSGVATQSLPSTVILGFANKANGTGAYKDSTITSATSTSTTNVNLSGTITGTIAVGMTETTTGAKVASVTYDSSTGKATSVTLSGTYTFTARTLNFTGSTDANLTLAGQYGVLQLNADGSYEYTPTANNSAIGDGQSFVDTFNYTMKDALNATSNATLNILVLGSNANDPNANADTNAATEKGGVSNGTAGVDPAGNVIAGTISLPSGGTGGQADSSSTQLIGAGFTGSATETSIYTTSTATVTKTSSTLTNVTGAANVVAGMTVKGTGIPSGTTVSSVSGTTVTLSAAVPSNATNGTYDILFVRPSTYDLSINGQYGTLVMHSDGSYVYAVNNDNATVQALHSASNTLQEQFSYRITNGQFSSGRLLTDVTSLTITIKGANDNPVASNDSATAIEASGYLNDRPGYNPSGNVLTNDSDVDDAASALRVSAVRTGATEGSGTAGTVGTALTGQYGSLTLNADGSWTYTVNNSNATVNALTSGQTLTDSFNYTVMDSSGVSGLTDIAVLAVTIQGADDTLAVNNIFVNEASPYAVFTVSGAAGMSVQLALGTTGLNSRDRLATLGTDTAATSTMQYLDGSTWRTYDANSPPVMPSGNQLLVRIAVTQDGVHEGNESFTLTATSGSQTAVGIGTINDEGEGDLYPNNTTGNKDTTSVKDDDRPLISINDVSVSEGGNLVFTASLSNASEYPISFIPSLTAGSATLGTDTAATNTLQVSYDNGAHWSTVSGAVTFAAGQTSMQFKLATVGGDGLVEGSENLYLSTSYINGVVKNQNDASGEGIIIDNDGAPAFSISDESVNEGAGTITFTVTRSGSSGSAVSVDYAVAPNTATTDDYSASVLSGLTGRLSFAAGETTKTIVLNVTNDGVYEGSESFYVNLSNASGATISDAQGVGTITDDGTGNGGNNDDRPVLTVTGVDNVSEGSYAVFTVNLDKPLAANTTIKLQLIDGTAVLADDLTTTTMQVVNSLSTAIGSGTNVSNGGNYTLAAGTQTFYVRVPTKSDSPAVYEGAENFTLTASFTAPALLYADRTGTLTTVRTGAADNDTSTILDDGSGKVYDGLGGNSGTPDDDRAISVTSFGPVNEGSQYAMFTVTASPDQMLDLALQGASSGTAATRTGFTYEWSTDGTHWTPYSDSSKPTAPADGKVHVRVDIRAEADTPYEGAETFALKASFTTNTSRSDAADTTIVDDGTGTKYGPNVDPSNGPNTNTSSLDDDRTISVEGYGPVNEGSQYAMFTVTSTPGLMLDLALQPATSGMAATRTGFTYEFSTDGTHWTTYDAGHKPTVPENGKVYVRVDIRSESDTSYEGSETFALQASFTAGPSKSASADTSIVDDGTGTKYGPDLNPDTGPVTNTNNLDDDRDPVVNSIAVNEASDWAVFQVSTVTGCQITGLDIETGSANIARSDDTSIQYWSGGTWNDTTISGMNVTLAPGGTLLVRVAILTEQDDPYEGAETFQLKVISNGNVGSVYGTATIMDDGTGKKYSFGPSGVTQTSGPGTGFDDDRPQMTIGDVVVEEGSTAVFNVTVGESVTPYTVMFGTSFVGKTASSNDISTTLVVKDDLGNVITANNDGSYTVPAGTTVLRVSVPTVNDDNFEGPETFSLTGKTSFMASNTQGTGTIKDDGSANDGDDPNGTSDDDRTISVTGYGPVNEGSRYAMFTVTASPLQSLDLDLQAATSGTAATLGGFTYEWSTDGTHWTTYSDTSKPTVPSEGKVFVRVDIRSEADTDYEGAETFALKASFSNRPSNNAAADTSIIDNGTGTKYGPDFTPSLNPSTDTNALDDDRTVSVTGYGPVNEGSQYAMFTVTATAGQMLDLSLQAATSGTPATRTGFTYQWSTDGTHWTTYDADHKPTAPDNGKVYVRVDISSESDTNYEGAETFALKASLTSNPAKSSAADTSIVDDGTGTKYGPNLDPTNGPATNSTSLDDDRPKAAPLPPPPPAPLAPPAPPAELAPPPPRATPPQAFASTLTPLAPALVPADPPMSLGDAITSGSGFQIPVSESAAPGLSLYQGITDQVVQSTNVATKVSLPFDAFIHSNKDAVIKLEAKQGDNSSLPKWVQFDPASGTFEVTPPAGFKGKLDLKVIARDDDGREAVAMFRMFIGEETQNQPQSRSSFSEKLRMAGKRPVTLARMAEAGAHRHADTRAMKVRAG